ncbi:MAG TPA: jacalin-like lectin [Pyrinomonadaceae bacterium]|nr:jacalin-like lectin [Pyrinomonadaceae bacterium]
MSYAFGPSGGVGGNPYSAPVPTTGNAPWTISGVQGRSGSRIDQIEIVWSSKSGSQSSDQFGGDGGDPFTFNIPSGDYLALISGSVGVNSGSVVLFSLQFFTVNGNKSPVFGSATSTPFTFSCPPGYMISGIFGRSGSAVDALGVYLDPIPT